MKESIGDSVTAGYRLIANMCSQKISWLKCLLLLALNWWSNLRQMEAGALVAKSMYVCMYVCWLFYPHSIFCCNHH